MRSALLTRYHPPLRSASSDNRFRRSRVDHPTTAICETAAWAFPPLTAKLNENPDKVEAEDKARFYLLHQRP